MSDYETTQHDLELIRIALSKASGVAADEASDQSPGYMFFLGRRLIETALRMCMTERYDLSDATIEDMEELLSAFAGPVRLAEFQREHERMASPGESPLI